MFVELTKEQISKKIDYIDNYRKGANAATSSALDANANVSTKNIATLRAELWKDMEIQVNRALLCRKIEELFDKETADEYLRQLKNHEIYTHDESSIFPYCVSISMYPMLLDGMQGLGGSSKRPTNLQSYCGIFENLVFAVSSQFAGAVATVEFLMYFDYFARKELGDNYHETHADQVKQHLQGVVHKLNQPAAARGYQAVFWNISVLDKEYFTSLFENFYFPEGEEPNYEGTRKLQELFMQWFNKERTKSELTFPVVTGASLGDENGLVDTDFANMMSSETEQGNQFFNYFSDSVDSLSSCCRLRNEYSDNTFSYSLGAGGVATGSINVITINVNRLVQDGRDIKEEVRKVHKYQYAYRQLMQDFLEDKMLTVYDAGFISIDKQFSTIGLNGFVEGAESLGIEIKPTEEYFAFTESILKPIYEANKEAGKEFGCKFNTEFVPAENLGVKFAKWDKKDGYHVPRDCYNSYFYIVEDDSLSIVEKIMLHGNRNTRYLDGGSALHLNLDYLPTKKQVQTIYKLCIQHGCNYIGIQVPAAVCDKCGNIFKEAHTECPACGAPITDYLTRVIGYLKRISHFSAARQIEADKRHYHKENK